MLYRCLSKQTRENRPHAHAQHSTALRHAKSPCMLTTLRVPIWQVSDWLDSRDESCIALVGHGQFFKRALRLDDVQPNVSIIRATYSRREGFVVQPEGGMAFPGFAEPAPP